MRWWDLTEVAALERRVVVGEPPWTVEMLWAELAGVPQRRYYLTAWDDGRLVGYAGMAVGPDSADVMTLGVDPSRRRRGTGSALLSALVGEAERRDVPEILLEVREGNTPAWALYERAGFERLARRRAYYPGGVDGWVLRLRLPRRTRGAT